MPLPAPVPVLHAVTSPSFGDYAGGVWSAEPSSEDCSQYNLNRNSESLLLVGYNTTAPEPYWIMKSSCKSDCLNYLGYRQGET